MTAAATASSRALRCRQSRTRSASRLSASRLVSRSSAVRIGTGVRSPQCIDKGSNPRRLSVRRPIQADRQADHDGRQPIVFLHETRNLVGHLIDSIAGVPDGQRQ